MKKLSKKTWIRTLLCVIVLGAFAPGTMAQVKGISYTLSPMGEYVFWNKNTGISDGFLVGGHLGFGFGEFVELRATYLQDVNNLKRDFSGLSVMDLRNAKLDTLGVGVQRWGGDLKLNLSRGGLVPYITVGTGVQTISPDSLKKHKNIYVAAGAGLQFSAGDRYTLNFQAVNTTFNDSPLRSLTSAAERTANGLATADYPNELLKNWSVRASLIFYLGGRRPGELTEVDKAYLNNFSSGISLPIEVTAGQLDFGKSLPYANTKYIGVSSGFNFGPYVGIRGFYWRGMDEGYFSKVSRLALYGGEGKFKLSNGQGLTPSINIGGGVIDALKGYEVAGKSVDPENKPFVSGGLGLDLPFSRALKLTAYAKALLTSNDLLENTVNPDELTTSWAYGLSLNLLIGNGAKKVETAKEESYDELVMSNMKREKSRAEDLKKEYQDQVDRLDDEIRDARRSGNRSLARDLEDEQDRLNDAIDRLSDLKRKEEKANEEAYKSEDALLMNMKPTEYRSMLDEIDQANSSRRSYDRRNNDQNQRSIDALEDRLKSIEQKLDDMRRNNENYRRNQRSDRPYGRNEGDQNEEYRQNRGNDYGSNTDGDYRQNRNDDYRRNMGGNAGSENNATYHPDSTNRMAALEAERRKSEAMRQAYEDRIDELNDQLREAGDKGDGKREADLNEEKESLESGVREIREAQDREGRANRRAFRENDPSLMQMEADEFRSTLDNVDRKNERYRKDIERSLERLEKSNRQNMDDFRNSRDSYQKNLENEMDDLRNEIRQLRSEGRRNPEMRIDTATVLDDREEAAGGITEQAEGSRASSAMGTTYLSNEQRAYQSPNLATDGFFSRLNYDGSSALAGFNLGGATTFNIGIRNHYRYKATNFFMMPEAFFGFGASSTFGLFLNGVYDIKLKNADDFSPYAGLGLGVMKIGSSEVNNTKAAFNIVLGANLFKIANGRFYVDVSARNLFKYTQLAAGYRLPF